MPKDVKTGEVLPATNQKPREVVDRFRRQLDLESGLPGETNARDVVERIQAGILTADSDTAVFDAANAGLASAEDLTDVPLVILDYSANRSTFTEGGSTGFYAVVSAYNLDDDVEVTFSIGAESAIAQLVKFNDLQLYSERTFRRNGAELRGLPCAIRGKKTAAGYTALFFQPLTDSEKKRTGVEWPIR